LPKLIGLTEALPLILQGKTHALHCIIPQGIQNRLSYCNTLPGKTLNGSKAKKLGLVDSVADPFALEHAAVLVSCALESPVCAS
jgi:hypothetical protein